MRLLALDTSTEFLSLALWQDGEVCVRELMAGQKHSELVLPLLGELLAEAGWQLPQLDGIAFGMGPGSFTGLRIGCGVAQGLAFGAGLPVIGVGTLQALAQQALEQTPESSRVIACLDARMQEVYHAAYEKAAEGWREVLEPGLYPPEKVPAVSGEGWSAIGSGWDQFGEVLDARYTGQIGCKIADAFPLARHMVALAAPRFARGEGLAAHQATPLYVRNKVAFTIKEREQAK